MTVTFLIPTIGRSDLARTLASIECREGDEILVVGSLDGVPLDERCRFLPCPPKGDWGHTERNIAMPHARGQYIAHIDDDDWYAPGARDAMADAMEKTPGRPVIFRMQYPNGRVLWNDQEARMGNVGTPMMFLPNDPERLGVWGAYVGGDFNFLQSSKWGPADYVWRSEVIALLGHN